MFLFKLLRTHILLKNKQTLDYKFSRCPCSFIHNNKFTNHRQYFWNVLKCWNLNINIITIIRLLYLRCCSLEMIKYQHVSCVGLISPSLQLRPAGGTLLIYHWNVHVTLCVCFSQHLCVCNIWHTLGVWFQSRLIKGFAHSVWTRVGI